MAAAALRKRDAAAAKLSDSTRQLRRYLSGDNVVERILVQKADKVDLDREELLARHIEYGERSGTELTENEMRTYIETRVDDAVDLVDEAHLKLGELKVNLETAVTNAANERKQLEQTTKRLHCESCERLMQVIITEIEQIIDSDQSGISETNKVNSALVELDKAEIELNKSWNDRQTMITDAAEMETFVAYVENIKGRISSCRRNAGAFIATSVKNEENESDNESATIVRTSTSKIHKLPRIKPPKFSGDIRDFARFKGDYERIVENEYDDEVHQVYVMKESCLEGEALNLVRNLQTLEEIWKRLSDRYGNAIDVVDAVLSDLDAVQVPIRFNKHQGLIKLIDTVERGVQDLTAIGKRNEIANEYTVKLIEKKLPPLVYREWVGEEDKDEDPVGSGSKDRFETMLEFLKRERRKCEKIVQQSKERDKDRDGGNRREDFKDNRNKRENVHHQANQGNVSKRDCIIHTKASSHLTRKCKEFLGKTAEERAQLVKDLGACKLCLSLSHVGGLCPFESSWDPCNVNGCTEMHSRLLHGAPVLKNMHLQQSQVAAVSDQSKQRTLLLMQEIIAENGKAFTFWDNGSGISLVSKRYARRNKLKGVKVSYDLVTVNNVITPQHTMLYDVRIVGRNGEVNIIVAYEIEEICEETAFFDRSVTDLFKNLNPDDVKRPRGKVDLLIGMNYIKLHPKHSETNGNLALFESSFGSGKVLGGQHSSIQGSDKTNAFAKMVAYGGMRNIRVERPEQCIDFFTAENLGVSAPARCKRCKGCVECRFEVSQLSKIEQQELEVIRKNLKLDPSTGKWVTSYPYRIDPSVLKDNREQALSLLLQIEKRLKKDEIASKSFCEQFDDMVTGGGTRDEVESIRKNSSAIMEKGGFHFKGFVISGDSKEEFLALLGSGEVGRVLGVGWNPNGDVYVVQDEIPTLLVIKFSRRMLLGVTNSIYDIYGFHYSTQDHPSRNL